MATASVAVRLNAITGEFETAFSNATRTVAGFEKTFGSAASSLAGHQQRMNAAFKEFSGDKIIAEANQLASAVTKVGGASKLTEAEQRKVNAAVTEAIAKYNALGQQAPAALQALARATEQVEKPTTLASKAMGVLGSTFAQFTAANLAATALTKLASGIGDFAAQGAKLPGLQSSFENLTRGVGSSSAEMLSSLQNATRGLVTNIDLMQSANKAILLGLPVTTKEMGDLAKTATVLGKAMGQDATKSLDDLITALGRSSPLILDNLGLTVKVGEANEQYAAKLGKTVEQLTDAEKKTAFYNAAMEAARTKVLELGEQTRTFGEIASSVWVSVGNEVTQTVSDINVGIGANIEALLRLIPKMKEAGDAAREGATKEKSWRDELDLSYSAMAAAALGLGGYNQSLKLHAEAAKASADAQQIFNKLVANAPKPSDVFKLGGAGSRPNQFGTQPLDITQYYKDEEAALKKTQKAAEDYAKTLREMAAARIPLTTGQRQSVDLWLREGQSIGDMAKVLRVSEVAVKKYAASQEDLRRSIEAAQKVTNGLGSSLKDYGVQVQLSDGLTTNMIQTFKALDVVGTTTLPGVKTAMATLPPEIQRAALEMERLQKVAQDALRNLAADFFELGQIAGGTFGQIISGFGGLVAAIDRGRSAIGAFKDGLSLFKDGASLAGIASMASGILGIVSAAGLAVNAIKGIFNALDRNKGRDTVEDFAGTFGGFDALHKELHTLGEEGERLWIALTQGVGRNNPEQARRVIDEITQAFAKQDAAREAATVSTEAGAQATIETSAQAAVALDELNVKIADNITAWGAWSVAVTGYLQGLADNIRALPMVAPGGGFSGGGVMTAPQVSYTGGGGAPSFAPASVTVGPEVGTTTAILQMDGLTIAEATVPHIPGVVRRYGLA